MSQAVLKVDSSHDFFEIKKHELNTKGFTVLTEDELPLSKADWDFIDQELSILPFKSRDYSESGEAVHTNLFRIKMSDIPDIHNQKLWDFFNGSKFQGFVEQLAGRDDIFIDRSQVHRYYEGGFLAYHVDAEARPNYIYSSFLLTDEDYEGGELIFYPNPDEPVTLKTKARTFVFLKSTVPHQLEKVTSGTRTSMINFYMA